MSQKKIFHFRLYVAGDAPNSQLAVANLRALCDEYLPGSHQVEIVDVTTAPARALADDVLLTPTLVKLAPQPIKRIVGNLSEATTVLAAIGLRPRTR